MLTKGAIGNLINRYKAVLAKCNLINTFGSLAVASMLVLGGAGVAGAAELETDESLTGAIATNDYTLATNTVSLKSTGILTSGHTVITLTSNDQTLYMKGYTGSEWGLLESTVDGERPEIVGAKGTVEIEGINDSYFVLGDSGSNINVNKLTLKNQWSGSWPVIYAGQSTAKHDIIAKEIKVISANDCIQLQGDSKEKYINISGFDQLTLTSTGNGYAIQNAAPADLTIIGNKNSMVEISSSERTAISQQSTGCTSITASTIDIKGFSTKQSSKTNSINITSGELSLNADVVNIYDMQKNGETTAIGISGGAINIKSSSTLIDGTTSNDGVFNIVGGETTFKDAITGSGTLNANEQAKLNITGANEIGTLGGNGTLLINDTDTTLSVNKLADGATASAKASGALNDALGGDMEAFKKQLSYGEDGEGDVKNIFGGADPGMIADGVDANGNKTKNEVMDAVLQQASITMVSLDKILTNDVRKRLGDIRSDANTTGVWMRWDGGKMKGDSGLTNNFNTIQIGGDTKAAKNCRIGFAGSFTHGDMDFNLGGGELEGFSFALYGTWMGENGMFADVVARLGKFSTEMTGNGRKGDMDNRVASLSGEYGWRLPVCDQFFVEPQVELAYTYVSSDDLQLGEAHYEFDSVDSLTGRAGVVAGWQLPEERGNVYARASVVQQFMGDAKVTGATSGKPVTQERDGEDTWLEYGIGANVKLTDSTYVWADVERTEGADIEEEWRGTVGVRFSF